MLQMVFCTMIIARFCDKIFYIIRLIQAFAMPLIFVISL